MEIYTRLLRIFRDFIKVNIRGLHRTHAQEGFGVTYASQRTIQYNTYQRVDYLTSCFDVYFYFRARSINVQKWKVLLHCSITCDGSVVLHGRIDDFPRYSRSICIKEIIITAPPSPDTKLIQTNKINEKVIMNGKTIDCPGYRVVKYVFNIQSGA